MVNKRIDSLMDTIERVAASNFIDHTMIETLTDTLGIAGINLRNLEDEWRRRIDSQAFSKPKKSIAWEPRVKRILEPYRGSDRQQFGLWIEKSYDLLLDETAKESLIF